MTTPREPDAEGADELPYLPAPTPLSSPPVGALIGSPIAPPPDDVPDHTSDDAHDPATPRAVPRSPERPGLPPTDPPVPIDPTGAGSIGPDVEPPPGDAPSRRVRAAMSAASGLDGAQRLRNEAARRQRRDERLGWTVAVALLVGVFAAGWFTYVAFRGDGSTHSRDALAASSDSAADTADATVAPRGAPVPADGGGTLAAPSTTTMDAAAPDPAPPATVAPDRQGPPARIANRPAVRTFEYDVRVYERADPVAPYRHITMTADATSDGYLAMIRDGPTGVTELVVVTGEWRYEVDGDGSLSRAQRSAASLDRSPDLPFAGLVAETDVLPVAARPYAVLRSESAEGIDGLDGSASTTYVYDIDGGGFRAAAPEAYAMWVSMWDTVAPDDAPVGALVVAGTELVHPHPFDVTRLRPRPAVDPEGLDVVSAADGPTVMFRVTERGIVDLAVLVDPAHDRRVVFVAVGYSDAALAVEMPADGWVAASP